MLEELRRAVPLPWKLRLLYARHTALSLMPGSGQVPLRMRDHDGFWTVEERRSGRRLFITAFERWGRFSGGIDAQLEHLAGQYGVGREVALRPGDQVIDIGANVGEFSLFAAGVGCRVLAVEADRAVAALLLRNTFGQANIDVEVAPVWKEDEEVTFHSSPDDADSSIFQPTDSVSSHARRAFRLDTLASKWFPDDRIRMVKCDAEGAEPEVLAGAGETLARTDWLAIDCGPERLGETTFAECRQVLESHGFAVRPPAARGRQVLLAHRPTG